MRLMKIQGRRLAATLVAFCLAVPPAGAAKDSWFPEGLSGDWSVVRSVPDGKRVVLKTKAGRTVRGFFQSATADSVTLRRKGRTDNFPADEVRTLSVLKPRLRNPLRWALAGASAFVWFHYCVPYFGTSTQEDYISSLVTASIFTGISTGAALLIRPSRWAIYESGAAVADRNGN